MKSIKCKIIGNQVWIAENLTKEQYYGITGKRMSMKNNNKAGYKGPKCYMYETNFRNKKKEYLFDYSAVELFKHINMDNSSWRIPTYDDLDLFFHNIDNRSSTEYIYDEIAINLRGTYGWKKNGTNKIGFNALPNLIINENFELAETGISRWWIYNDRLNEFEGFGLYQEDVVAFCGAHKNNAYAIRLVMDLQDPRIENNINYI